MTETNPQQTQRNTFFERKVLFSKWALVFEKFWPRFWLVIGVGVAFTLLSIFGVWEQLGVLAHQFVLATLGIALAATVLFALRVTWPSREQAIRRIERISKVAHRPASSYEDTLTAPAREESADVIWHAHRSRLYALFSKLRVGNPEPGTHWYDPMALRMAAMIAVVVLGALVGHALPERFAAAWDFEAKVPASTARLDAWVTPPSYTRKPPVMLSDGSGKKLSNKTADGQSSVVVEIPINSLMIVRATGTDHAQLSVEISTDTPKPEVLRPVKPEKKKTANVPPATVSEVRHTMTKSGRVRVLRGATEVGQWTFSVIPDELPKISFSKTPTRTIRGSMKLTYKAEDDYGVTSAVAKISRLPPEKDEDGKEKKSQLSKKVFTGPRPPYERPPVLTLQVPRVGTKKAEAKTTLELGKHPWAGMRVEMTLEATDVAGQVGKSRPLVLILPQRQFSNPLAMAVIEQRRKLVEDPRNRDDVLLALEALTLEPEGFIKDTQAYLGLRAAYYRLERDETRVGRNSVIEQLWYTALRIEDGDLSDAERRLREAQEKLAKMLKEGASEEEIKAAMDEMRQALNEYMNQLQKQQAQQDGDQPPGQDEQNQTVTEQDFEQMMKDLEEAAKNGSREQAEQMLSELRDMLDQMKAGQSDSAQAEQNREMQKNMQKLGEMMNEQKKLMDETFEERRKQQADKAGKRKGQRSGQENKGDHGQKRGSAQGQGNPGQEKRWGGKRAQRGRQKQARAGQQGQQQQKGYGQKRLGQRQKSLQDNLNRMKRELSELGIGDQKNLDKAEKAMAQAKKALEENRLNEATQQQGRALNQMRKGMQEIAKEMMENSPQRYGENKNPRDPLGRPQATQGPNQGNSVKVPVEIDRQRAREILEELRRRVGEVKRPTVELEYIERLLRRF